MSYDVEAGIGTGTRRSLILLQFLEVIFALTAMMVGIGGPTELGLGWFATLIGGVTLLAVPIEVYFEHVEPEKYNQWVTMGPDIALLVLWAAVPGLAKPEYLYFPDHRFWAILLALSVFEVISLLSNISIRAHGIRMAKKTRCVNTSPARIAGAQSMIDPDRANDTQPQQQPQSATTATPVRTSNPTGHCLREYSAGTLQQYRPIQFRDHCAQPENQESESPRSQSTVKSSHSKVKPTNSPSKSANEKGGCGCVDGAEEVEMEVTRTSEPPIFDNGVHPLRMNPVKIMRSLPLRSVELSPEP